MHPRFRTVPNIPVRKFVRENSKQQQMYNSRQNFVNWGSCWRRPYLVIVLRLLGVPCIFLRSASECRQDRAVDRY